MESHFFPHFKYDEQQTQKAAVGKTGLKKFSSHIMVDSQSPTIFFLWKQNTPIHAHLFKVCLETSSYKRRHSFSIALPWLFYGQEQFMELIHGQVNLLPGLPCKNVTKRKNLVIF